MSKATKRGHASLEDTRTQCPGFVCHMTPACRHSPLSQNYSAFQLYPYI